MTKPPAVRVPVYHFVGPGQSFIGALRAAREDAMREHTTHFDGCECQQERIKALEAERDQLRTAYHDTGLALCSAAAERDALRAQLDAVRAAFGHGADQESWRPGETLGEAVARLVAQLDEAREVLWQVEWTACGDCPYCGNRNRHDPGCRLAAVLRGPR